VSQVPEPLVYGYAYFTRVLMTECNSMEFKVISAQSPYDLEDIHFMINSIEPTKYRTKDGSGAGGNPDQLVLVYYTRKFIPSQSPKPDSVLIGDLQST